MQNRTLKYVCDSIQGIARTKNKDGVISIYGKNYHIFGVLDGVSSAYGAYKAVRTSIEFLGRKHSNYLTKTSFDLSGMMVDLNRLLTSSDITEPYLTCSIVYIPDQYSQNIKYINIGDSRIYSISKQYIYQLTTDDSDPTIKNLLTKYLGSVNLDMNDFIEMELPDDEKSQSLLVCTDGFYSVMERNQKKLREIHRVSNLKNSYYIKKGMQGMIVGSNTDDATYVIVRWLNV